MQTTLLARAAALALLAMAGSAQAVSFTQGDVTAR